MANTANKQNNTFLKLFFGILALVFGVIFFMTSSDLPPEAIDAKLVSFEELNTMSGYYIEDAVILDKYGNTTKDNKIESIECAVAFETKGGQWVIGSMKVKKNDPLYWTIDAYLNDDSQYLGDLRLPMAVTTSSLDSTFKVYLREYCAKDAPMDYMQDVDSNFKTAEIEMTYRGATMNDYASSVQTEQRNTRIGSLAAIIIGAALIGFAIVGKIRKREV